MPEDADTPVDAGVDAAVDAGPCTMMAADDTTCDGVDDDCDEDVDEDVDVSTDETSCGACGVTCSGGGECRAGLCSTTAVAVAAGFEHSCATGLSGRAYCWGRGSEGRLGTGMATSVATPVEVTALLEDTHQLGAGEKFSCARVVPGTVWCWGDDGVGQLGNGAGGPVGPTLVELPMGTVATHLAVGFEHACVATSTGQAYCWGRNDRGQLGDGTMGDAQTPVLVSTLSGVTWIAAGLDHSCAVTDDGSAYCWGDNLSRQLGSAVTGSTSMPARVSGLEPSAVAIAAGDVSTCAVLASGGVRCWGRNSSGQIGDGSGDIATVPRVVSGPRGGALADAMYVSVGSAHACAVTRDSRVVCWGENGDSQLGLGAGLTMDSRIPVYVPGLTGIARVSAGTTHTCAIARDRSNVWCWGANNEDQLGDGSGISQPEPVPVAF
jgi:alpha-tubulin suppressor-like RCC1 family protein